MTILKWNDSIAPALAGGYYVNWISGFKKDDNSKMEWFNCPLL